MQQCTIARPFTVSGPGLHTGRRSTVTLRPAAADHGRRVAAGARDGPRSDAIPMTWDHRVPSPMSTALDLGNGRTVRTIEHLMASLSAFGVDDVLIEVDGFELPIFDGSAARWCRELAAAGLAALPAPRRAIRVLKPVQVFRDGGFLRAEPAESFSLDVTYDVLPTFPVMRWAGTPDRAAFTADLSLSRSFGRLDPRKLLRLAPGPVARPPADPPVAPNARDAALVPHESEAVWTRIAAQKAVPDAKVPVLRGARPGRSALIVGRTILGGARYADEPVRHVALDVVGDLALAGAPLIGRVVAHNPSHEKTYAFVAALMADPTAWERV